MLAFSPATQFPTNGFSTREDSERVQASSSADHITTAETRRVGMASAELGTPRTFLDWLAVIYSSGSRAATAPQIPGRDAGVLVKPRITGLLPSRGKVSPTRGLRCYCKTASPQSRELHVKRPIYAGADRALVRLASGEYICVDTNSLDATDYLLGWTWRQAFFQCSKAFCNPIPWFSTSVRISGFTRR